MASTSDKKIKKLSKKLKIALSTINELCDMLNKEMDKNERLDKKNKVWYNKYKYIRME